MEKVQVAGYLRREYHAARELEIPFRRGEEPHIVAVVISLVRAREIREREQRRIQYHRRHQQPDHRFERRAAEILEGEFQILTYKPQNIIDDHEDRDAGDEKVAVKRAPEDHEAQPAALSLLDAGVERQYHEREKRHDVVEVVKDEVEHLKAGESVDHSSGHREILVSDALLYHEIRAHRRERDLQAVERRYEVGRPGMREEQRYQKERAAEQIERIRAYRIDAHIGIPVPEKLPVMYRAVDLAVKRDLLKLKIPEEKLISARHYHHGQKDRQRKSRSEQEHGQPVMF